MTAEARRSAALSLIPSQNWHINDFLRLADNAAEAGDAALAVRLIEMVYGALDKATTAPSAQRSATALLLRWALNERSSFSQTLGQ